MLELKNLSRQFGSFPEERGTEKVNVIAKHLKRIGANTGSSGLTESAIRNSALRG